MSDFKDMIAKDLDTFTNPDEFAEQHNIGGKSVTCVIDSDVLSERQGGTEFGMNESNILVYAKTELLKEKGIEVQGFGSHLNIDGRIYTVISWSEKMGMSAITLSVPQMD